MIIALNIILAATVVTAMVALFLYAIRREHADRVIAAAVQRANAPLRDRFVDHHISLSGDRRRAPRGNPSFGTSGD